MVKTIELTLPVMLHSDKEPPVFLEAKQRIEAIGAELGLPIKVSAFLPFLPGKSRTSEGFASQLENQRRHRLPIALVETGVQQTNALSYVPTDPTFDSNKPSDLERTIEQAARLRDLDPSPKKGLVIAPHVGVLVADSIARGDFSRPSFYSVPDFVERRERIYGAAKERFAQLSDLAKKNGLRLGIENAYLAVVEDSSFWKDQTSTGRVQLHYQVFNDLSSLVEISRGNVVFDAAHLAAMTNVPARFEANKGLVKPDGLFATMGISSWDEYSHKVGSASDYLERSIAAHISQTDGIGVRLKPGTEDGRLWGCGEGPDLTSVSTYHSILKAAQERGMPVGIEQDFKFSPLTYTEADPFLRLILQDFSKR